MFSDTRCVREPPDYGLLATNLADMARELQAQATVARTLDSIVTHAVKLVEGCEAAGILSIENGIATPLAASDAMAQASDRIQAQLGEGPCFDASVHRVRVYGIEDMHQTGSRWPRYAQQARDLGVGSMVGFPLYTNDEDNLGALHLYSRQRGAFGAKSEHVGWVVASHAAVALSNARHAENMGRALRSSRVIAKAIGIVMCSLKLSEEAAFQVIRQASRTQNIKVGDLAQTIVATGGVPVQPLAARSQAATIRRQRRVPHYRQRGSRDRRR